MRIGFMRGYLEGQREATSRLERTMQLLSEQLADLRFELRAQRERADRAVDLVVRQMGLPEISGSALAERAASANRTMMNTRPTIPNDPFEDMPIGHPNGSYKTQEEAALRPEDVSGAV